MASFSVILCTASPPGQGAEAGGAYVKIEGREALLRSVELFLNRDPIKQIQLVVQPDMLEEARRKFGGHLGFSGVKLVGGGPKWIDQLIAAGEKLWPDSSHILVHDAARPAVAYSDIDALIESADKHTAIALVSPLRNPIVEIDEGGNALAMHRADQYMNLLTPQCFSRAKFTEMIAKKSDPHPSELHLLKGSSLNVRVSGSGDAGFVNTMIKMLPKPKLKPPSSPFEEAQW